ncbi:polysaccharide deacetylase family protein [Flavobacteriaceae bacterium]|nr:polysaccharide deacetylase family protein [Flavobacteriaceae bacterium]MDC1492645.1 polysaccharide deacetylase family protein [Flavobacteriaceae bacterium]
MILVYTPKITRRIEYIFKHIFINIIGIKVSFTAKVDDFVSFQGPKFSYAPQKLSNEFYIKSNSILLEQGFSDIDIDIMSWEDSKCFFYNENGNIPFDIFAASFYLISRYEEYLPHLKDVYGRFSYQESIAYKNDFLEDPIVDVWAQKLKKSLHSFFPEIVFEDRQFKTKTIIDVPTVFYYKSKGFLRTISGMFTDLLRLKPINIYTRLLVIFGLKKDPYDTFNWIINKQKQVSDKFLFFFLVGKFSTYDKNISLVKQPFINIIKLVSDYSRVGLKLSFFALNNIDIFKREKADIESITNRDLLISRNSFSKVNLPVNYRNLIKLNIKEDYTMGYVNKIGFRASTCTPFLFYDIDNDIQTPLLISPYNLMDYSLININSYLDKKEKVIEIIDKVKRVNGTFTSVFHNYCFSNEARWSGFKEIFEIIINSNKDE